MLLLYFFLAAFFSQILPAVPVSLSSSVTEEHTRMLREKHQLDKIAPSPRLSQFKIAVIDKGFAGMEDKSKRYLPESAKVIESYPEDFIQRLQLNPGKNLRSFNTSHGRVMAQEAWAVTGQRESGPQFYLLNGNGIINFQRAVKYAIQEQVDIVLYANEWLCCSNFNGDGELFNSFVNEAAGPNIAGALGLFGNLGVSPFTLLPRKPILWVNSAGNNGEKNFDYPIVRQNDGWLRFGDRSTLRIENTSADNTMTVTLNWYTTSSDRRELEKAYGTVGTDRDLDLFVYETDGTTKKGEGRQVYQKTENQMKAGETLLAREVVTLSAGIGETRIAVKAFTNNFTKNDRLRITISGEKFPIQFIDATPGRQIMTVADNHYAITVGTKDKYSAVGPTTDGRIKPEVILDDGKMFFTDRTLDSEGTTNADAIFGGMAAVWMLDDPTLNREGVLQKWAASNIANRARLDSDLRIDSVDFSNLSDDHSRIYLAIYRTVGRNVPIWRMENGTFRIQAPIPLEVLQERLARNRQFDLAITGSRLRILPQGRREPEILVTAP